MDTRILLDYMRRWAWLWLTIMGLSLVFGFAPLEDISFVLAMPLIYLVIPMSTEFRKQGPMWMHRTLPVRDRVLARTSWVLAVVLPVAAVVLSLLPAAAFGLLTGRSNLALDNLLPLMAGGLLWTSAAFSLTALGGQTWPSKPLQVLFTAGSFLLAGGLVLVLMKAPQYWGSVSIRSGLILGVLFLLPASYLASPQVLQGVVRNHGEESRARPGETQALYADRPWDRIMAQPIGRTLLTGVWLLAFLFWMNLFYAVFSGRPDWYATQAMYAIAPVGMQMMAMFLFLYSFAHVTSLRGMAVLPISRVRRTLTIVSLPLAAAMPFTLVVTAQMVIMKATAAELLQFAVTLLFCLVTAYVCLAVCLRFGFIAAITGLMLFMFVVMLRVMMAGTSWVPALSGWDGLVGVILILVAGLWIHRILDRHPGVYRRHWIPAGMRRG